MILDQRLRHSLPSRITAVSFIIVILFGNLWLALAVIGKPAPEWIGAGFFAGIAGAILGGIGLLVATVMLRLRAPDEPS